MTHLTVGSIQVSSRESAGMSAGIKKVFTHECLDGAQEQSADIKWDRSLEYDLL